MTERVSPDLDTRESRVTPGQFSPGISPGTAPAPVRRGRRPEAGRGGGFAVSPPVGRGRAPSPVPPKAIPTTVHCQGRARGNPPYRDGDEHLNSNGGSTESDNSESVY
jgi:hypothetical protein